MFFRRKKQPPDPDDYAKPERQYWDHDPKPTDSLIVPDVELVHEDAPAEVFPDEIDPEWADTGEAHEDD
jgi:hypothetical protein